MDTTEIAELRHALVQHCGLSPAAGGEAGREALIEELARRVDFLLSHDLDRLMSYMYMLDVPEDRFAQAVTRPASERPARILAELILSREAEKLDSRRRHSGNAHPAQRPELDELE